MTLFSTRSRGLTKALATASLTAAALMVVACVPQPGTGTTTTTESTTTTEATTTTTEATTTTTTPVPVDEVSTIDVGGSVATFATPTGIAVGPDGALYVAQFDGTTVVAVTPDPDGAIEPVASGLNKPSGVAVDAAGTVYIADQHNHRIVQVDADGNQSVLAGSGSAGYGDGTGTAASFNFPTGIAVADDGTIYVTDRYNNCIRAITAAGEVTTVTCSGLSFPSGLAATDTTLFVADELGNRVLTVDRATGTVAVLAGSGTAGDDDGTGGAASFNNPSGVAVGPDGTLYVTDWGNHRIRSIDPATGAVSTLAGSTIGQADGPRSTATFDVPYGIAATDDALYVVEFGGNHIRRIALP
ncbi:hypothetical protein [Dermatobacter hominis]|uniref:hypothetical protein n=1 Tax=Dermatobacter hominis TaxID=2884263 RepID=UPI001D122B19|nr:hypothetical protein [Dermatobacter hominis]UDY37605.1 hypothetical protein LH044_08710 [Dermatobacter hominis]